VLVLLHGLGDTHAPFANFARSLQLADTVCLAVRAPAALPFDLHGFHWGDDIVFDEGTGEMDVDTGFKKSVDLLVRDVIEKCLCEKCGYTPRDVILFGFGQGGCVALGCAAAMKSELGGVVSIGDRFRQVLPMLNKTRKAVHPFAMHGKSPICHWRG